MTRTKMMLTGEKARQEDGGGAKAPGRIIIINSPMSLLIIVTSFESDKFGNSYIELVIPELGLIDARIIKPTFFNSLLFFFVKNREGVDMAVEK